ncbi:FCD domain-containing protein [Arthrobacter woluwensis]|uniref:FCD domain-containing protein n=1 Tax=Arthrobacter woluwensis TaxID=156980 RepID=UPI001AAE2300|nr:FCD domain-containing protein [Arthrobacter woluwensis]QTF73076.1 FCD domain-containing protein [Arthrobacter woluwensis]
MPSEHTPHQPLADHRDFGKRLEHWIDSGVWPEGGLLPARDELALIFGAHELEHAHEVIDGLHHRGILTTRPEDGRLVIGVKGNLPNSSALAATPGRPGPDHERWQLINEARRALLSQGARLAASRASAESLDRLGLLLHGDVGMPGADPSSPATDFEREVIVASGNELMLRIYDRLLILELMTRTGGDATGPDDGRLAFARRELLTAIAARQPQAAALLADRIP